MKRMHSANRWVNDTYDMPEGNRIVEFVLQQKMTSITKVDAFVSLI
jgi:hypothetical protein